MAAQITLSNRPSGLSPIHRHVTRMLEFRPSPLTGLSASLAEMMLVNKLRARTRRDLALDTLQRGVDIIELTAKHWFAGNDNSRDVRSTTSSSVVVL